MTPAGLALTYRQVSSRGSGGIDRVADPAAAGVERFVGLEHIEPEDLRIRRWGLVAEGTTFTNLFRPGQVLFGKRRAYQRKVAVAEFEGVCSAISTCLSRKTRTCCCRRCCPSSARPTDSSSMRSAPRPARCRCAPTGPN
jgi:hypothetical protein